jgi:nitroreductase
MLSTVSAKAPPGADAVFSAIASRRSVRSYRPEVVEHGQLQRLIDAAVLAPSARNSQPWSFVVVQDPLVLRRLAADATAVYLSEPAMPEVTGMSAEVLGHFRALLESPGYEIFHHAPALVVIYAESEHGVADCYLAAENLMLAAWAMGLGTCPMGLARPLLNRAEVKRRLGVREECVEALALTVGVPVNEAAVVGPGRRPAEVSWR